MERKMSIGLVLFVGLVLVTWWGCAEIADTVAPAPTTPRRTVIFVENAAGTRSEILNTLVFSQITTVAGVTTLQTQPFQLGTTAGRLRFDSGHLAYSDDSGATYQPLRRAHELASPIAFQNQSGQFRWYAADQVIQYSNNGGATWAEIGSGSGGTTARALHSADHTNVFATYTSGGAFPALNADTLQAVAFVNFTALATAENIFHRISPEYSCTIQRFGKDATNHLVYEHATQYTPACTTTVYTSTTTLSGDAGRWLELAVQVHEGGNLTFYIDGVAETQAMTSALLDPGGAETLYLYEGWGGYGGPVKINTRVTWPTTGSKGLSLETILFGANALWFPLSEGRGVTLTDAVSGAACQLDPDVTWRTLPGGW